MTAASRQPEAGAQTYQRGFLATWDDISEAALWLEEAAKALALPDKTLFNMQLCLEELLTNIVKHGGNEVQSDSATTPVIELSLAVQEDAAVLVIEDNAKPFDVAAAQAHAIDQPIADVTPGGLGVQLIKSFASEIAYQRAGLGNQTTLRFHP